MTRQASAWLIAAALLQPIAALAADVDLAAPAGPAQQTAPAPGSVFAPPDAACLEWTDGCRTCQKPPGGEAACSNVGTACTAQAPRCTRR